MRAENVSLKNRKPVKTFSKTVYKEFSLIPNKDVQVQLKMISNKT
jgi:hypothetical protein